MAIVSSVPQAGTNHCREEADARAVHVLRPPHLSLRTVPAALRRLPLYGNLAITLTVHRLRVRYRQSILGPLWAVLQPLLMMLIFTAVFTVISRVPSGHTPYALIAYTGLLPWTAFATAVSSGATSLVGHAPLVTRVAFPREILPFTYVAAALVDAVIASTVLLALMAYYAVPVTPAVLWVVPVMVVLALLSLGLSLALAAFQVHVRDIGLALPALLQLWMFASPVIYPLSAVPAGWRRWYDLNPLVGIVDTFRRATLEGQGPDAAFAVSVAWVALLPLAYAVFKQLDATMADTI